MKLGLTFAATLALGLFVAAPAAAQDRQDQNQQGARHDQNMSGDRHDQNMQGDHRDRGMSGDRHDSRWQGDHGNRGHDNWRDRRDRGRHSGWRRHSHCRWTWHHHRRVRVCR